MPALMKELDSPVLSGLIFVGICSAIMSTMDSMFNTGAMALTIDVFKRYISPQANGQRLVLVGRISTFLMASLALLIAINIRSVLTVSWIGADFIASGAFVPLIIGFLWKGGTKQAAFFSMIFGFLFSSYNFAVALAVPLPTCWEIASVQQALIGITASLIIYVSVSLFTQRDGKEYSRAQSFIDRAKLFGK